MTETAAHIDDAIPAARILIVDDEPDILSSLRRLLRASGFDVLAANSGEEGLRILESAPVDVVVSDMRMANMSGAQFLEQVFLRWPDIKRILLTGYSDAESTVAAINRGKIWRYIAKPWNNDDLVLTIQQAVAHRQLMNENARLLKLTRDQNEELRLLNASLETRVEERTRQLQQALKDLHRNFVTTVNVFSSMMELRGGVLAGHSRRVADLARRVSRKMNLDDASVQDVVLAALLHDIGKLGLPDETIERPFNTLPPEARAEVMKHPVKGEMLLMPVGQLAGAALLIRHHHEMFDGSGYPDGLSGMEIPLGARILAVVNDYDALQLGLMVARKLKPAEALRFIVDSRGRHYDPTVVDAFTAALAEGNPQEFNEIPMRPATLQPGLRLTRDLFHHEGYMLLSRDHVLTAAEITQLMRLESAEKRPITLFVERPA